MLRYTYILSMLLICVSSQLFAQSVGINATGTPPHASAVLDLEATDKGLLIPRLDSTQRHAISSPATGLMVFDTDYETFWFYDGLAWLELTTNVQLERETKLVQEDVFPDRVKPDFSCLQIRNSLTVNHFVVDAMAIRGDSAFMTTGGQDTLLIVDISDPVNPQVVDSVPLNGNFGVSSYGDIEFVGDYLYAVDEIWSEIGIVDLSGSSASTVSRYYIDFPRGLDFQGSRGVLVNDFQELRILDFSNPTSPVSVGTVSLTGSISPFDLVISENEAYVVGSGSSPNLLVYDISQPGPPSFLASKRLNFNAFGIGIQGDLAYVAGEGTDNFKVVDISDPSQPVFRDSLTIPGITGFTSFIEVWVEGLYAYVIVPITNQLVIVDISNPDDLSIAETITFSNRPTDLSIQGNLAFVTDVAGDLHTVQLSCFPSSNVAINPFTGGFIPNPNTSTAIDSTDELQSITKNGNLISLSLGGGTVTDSVRDDDADPNNELQNLSLSGNDLTLSNGNTVTLPVSDILADTDGDTRILVESNMDEDKIRFDVSGTERLQMSESGLLSEGTFVSNYTGAIPDSGAGIRMMWVPQKAALRIGEVKGAGWDIDSLGDRSAVVGGDNNRSFGASSFSGGGTRNIASGENAFVGGGIDNQAFSYAEAVFGHYATTYSPSSTSGINSNDRLFVIGNGSSSSSRSNALTILKNGNTGIGTTANPAYRLDVNGNARISDLAGSGTRMVTVTAAGVLGSTALPGAQVLSLSGSTLSLSGGGGSVNITESDPQVGSNVTNYLPKWNGSSLVASNAIYEDSDGDLGVGTTTTTHVLTVESNDEETMRLIGPDNFGHGARLNFGDSDFVYLEEPTDDRLRIQATHIGIRRTPLTNSLEVEGNASKSTAGDWLANSDARLKKNLTALNSEEILAQMLQLQGVTYEWNDTLTGSERPTGIQYGFTAQNIQQIFPELVFEDNLGFLQTSYGTYDAMYVESIRALHTRIEKLEAGHVEKDARIEELERKLQAVHEFEARLQSLENALQE